MPFTDLGCFIELLVEQKPNKQIEWLNRYINFEKFNDRMQNNNEWILFYATYFDNNHRLEADNDIVKLFMQTYLEYLRDTDLILNHLIK